MVVKKLSLLLKTLLAIKGLIRIPRVQTTGLTRSEEVHRLEHPCLAR